MKLSDGFEINIIPDALDNWELLEALRKIDQKEAQYLPDAARMLLGEDGLAALREHLRNENGIVKTSDMIAILEEIFTNAKDDNELKK